MCCHFLLWMNLLHNVTSHLLTQINPVKRIPGQFVNKTFVKTKTCRFNCEFVSIQTNINSWMCIKQPPIII